MQNTANTMTKSRLLLLCFTILLSNLSKADVIKVYFDASKPQVSFAVSELESILEAKGHSVIQMQLSNLPKKPETNAILFIKKSNTEASNKAIALGVKAVVALQPEGFSLDCNANGFVSVLAIDDAGLMYGGLELAEQIENKDIKSVVSSLQNPYMAVRGTKFNIPLDVRTPSYSDVSDAGQKNIANMWDFSFWTEYIDAVARSRYNLISLWNMNPFPSMVKVPEYPEVALNDVQRSTAQWKEVYSMAAADFNSPEILNNVEVVKKITIDEKIEFWRKVMKYGKERNVQFFIITWNILTYGAEGKHGIINDFKNEITIDYFRKSVKQMVLTYPDLAGIGISPSDNFSKEATPADKEEWVYRTFGLGLLDAVTENPDRRITFIHRSHALGVAPIVDKFRLLIENKNIHFVFSNKYSQGHSLSSTIQPFSNEFVKELRAYPTIKTLWTLRNDDNFYFRWGAPDFVREFIQNIPAEVSEGMYYGSDNYIWGREFLSNDPRNAGELEINKHWYHFTLWGRLAYNPKAENEVFKNILASRFGISNTDSLFEAWQAASMIYPITTGFHWAKYDLQWYIEGCKGLKGFTQNETGFHDVNSFINLPAHPGTRNQTIPAYVAMIAKGLTTDSITPIQIALLLHQNADKALILLKAMKPTNNIEYNYTLKDIEAMAYLGKYFAFKIQGAIELQKYREISRYKKENQMAAVEQLTQAGIYWKMYAALIKQSYKTQLWTNRVGNVDFDEIYRWVMDDLTIAKGAI